jgi:hypothetical protein
LAWELLFELFLIKQDKKEPSNDFHDRFKSYNGIIKRCVDVYGAIQLMCSIERDALRANVWERLIAYDILANANPDRYDKWKKFDDGKFFQWNGCIYYQPEQDEKENGHEVKKTKVQPKENNPSGVDRDKEDWVNNKCLIVTSVH